MNDSAARAYAFEDDDAHDVAEVAREESVISVGAYLSRQRRLRGLSLDELEAATRIPRRSLARLEAGAFDRLQDAFVRGFVRTVAGAIGVDPGDTLVRMLEAEAGPSLARRTRPWRALGLALLAAFGLAACGAGALALAGRDDGAGAPARSAPDPAADPSAEALVAAEAAAPAPPPQEPAATLRRDPVRVLAERVRTSTPGAFARPRPVTPPPSMFVAPAARAELDAILPRPVLGRPAPAAVSAGG